MENVVEYDMNIRNLGGMHDIAPDARWCEVCLVGGTILVS